MSRQVRVTQGQCIASLAWEHGQLWQTIWECDENRQLREKRENPNILEPGDIVVIPDVRQAFETGSTEEKHKFVRRRSTVTLKLRLIGPPLDDSDDDALPADEIDHDDPDDDTSADQPTEYEPRANMRCVVETESFSHECETDDDGCIELEVPATTVNARVTLGDEPHIEVYEVLIGGIDPVDTLTGIQQRLVNLGYVVGPIDGIQGPQTSAAVRQFRIDHGLNPDDDIDDAFKNKISEIEGC